MGQLFPIEMKLCQSFLFIIWQLLGGWGGGHLRHSVSILFFLTTTLVSLSSVGHRLAALNRHRWALTYKTINLVESGIRIFQQFFLGIFDTPSAVPARSIDRIFHFPFLPQLAIGHTNHSEKRCHTHISTWSLHFSLLLRHVIKRKSGSLI